LNRNIRIGFQFSSSSSFQSVKPNMQQPRTFIFEICEGNEKEKSDKRKGETRLHAQTPTYSGSRLSLMWPAVFRGAACNRTPFLCMQTIGDQ
jgi:hypothetical protein